MAKKSFANLGRGKNVREMIEEIDVSSEVKEVLEVVDQNPTGENISMAVEKIEKDSLINPEDKLKIIGVLREQFISLFNFENCPSDYKSLKNEAKFLAGMTQYSFILMAQRLLKIRNHQLYKEDGYPDFKSFITYELPIAQRTAYDYIDIVNLFDLELRPFAIEERFEYTKLLPVIPLLKAENSLIPKDQLKERFLKESRIKTKRQITEEATELKLKYGLIKDDLNKKRIKHAISVFLKSVPSDLDQGDKEMLKEFIGKIDDMVK